MEIKINVKVLITLLLFSVLAVSQKRNQSYLLYITQYNQLAVKQQNEHGIPASITLAQGLLESGAGHSTLSLSSNNHFGIKCTDWAGDKVYYDDDEKGECFRKYNRVLDSYEDHALFLKNRTRYATLFLLPSSDYEGWAFGLKKAGYATDPTYAFKLISIIEDYDLHRFDIGTIYTNSTPMTGKNAKNKTTKNGRYGSMGSIKAVVNHLVLKVNGVKFVTSLAGDTYAGIADEYDMSEEKLRFYNEVSLAAPLTASTRVFLSLKKNKAPKECETHIIQPSESIRSIGQDYGVKTVSLYKLNKMDFSRGASLGQVLKLR